MTTFVTTAGRPDGTSFKKVAEAQAILPIRYVERKKRSIAKMHQIYEADFLVAGKERFEYYQRGYAEPLFFHPNSASFRVKRIINGEIDPLIETSQLKAGDRFLDCTVGLGADSIVASAVVGETGSVIGLEIHPIIAFLTTTGLQSYTLDRPFLQDAMQRITIIQENAVTFLSKEPDHSWDVVYMDPMFTQPIVESTNFTVVRHVGHHATLSEQWMFHAKRVCKRCVIVKDHYQSDVFKQFQLQQIIRPHTKFHYGIWSKLL